MYTRKGNMLFFVYLFFIIDSLVFLTTATADDNDYDPDYRNLQMQVEADKQARDLLLRELYRKLFQQQQLQPLQPQQPPLFTYKFPPPRADETFAVPPSDPRYYYPNVYEDQEKFLRHMKAEDVEDGDSPLNYKGVSFDAMTDDDSDTGAGKSKSNKIQNNYSDEDFENNVEQPLQPLKSVLSVPRSAPLEVEIIKTPFGIFQTTRDDMIFIAVVAGCTAAAVLIIAGIGFGWYRLHKKAKAAADVDYPAYGVTGPNKEISPTGDRKLAESAQMYHYQHQKQQIISMSSSRASNEHRGSGSEAESDEENEEGDYTVYECPGLAATGEMEVKNPLFLDDPTPAAAVNQPTICQTSPDSEEQKPQK